MAYFCEYLPRLKSVSVCIDVGQDVLGVESTADGSKLQVRTASRTILVPLPARTASSQRVPLREDTTGRCISFRLPCVGGANDTELQKRAREMDILTSKDSLQWSAKRLAKADKSASFHCANCNATLVPLQEVRSIHAMPSEFWSEMMEFWHCHRPEAGAKYSMESVANRFNQFRPAARGMIVGSCYIILNPGDWPGITVKNDSCVCTSCGEILGQKDDTGNYRIWMWKMLLVKDDTAESYPAYFQAYSSLLDSVSSTAVRVYTVNDRKLLLWVFNYGLDVTLGDSLLSNCLKIMYKTDSTEISRQLEESGQSNDTLELAEEPYRSLIETLEANNASLPKSQREFNGYKVSYLAESTATI